ncbi:MAG TPA: hypothetical protein VFI20_09405 [Terracidiphilus sp.]|nr:hypothetical protein [Terracidiphilus sp.]
MKNAIYVILAIFVALPAWAQVEPSMTGGNGTPDDESRMLIPTPVSVAGYPTEVGAQERANYLSLGALFTAAYDDNIVPGFSPVAVSDYSYLIAPTLSVQQRTPRMSRSLTYSPGFRFYQRVSSLNAIDQNADADFQYRLSPRATFDAHDTFQQNSNTFNQPYAVAGGVSGSTLAPGGYVIAPYADQLMNTARAVFTYQFALNSMVGGGGTTSLLNYPSLSQVPGLANFRSEGGEGFYSRRVSRWQYVGGLYQYTHIATNPIESTTQTHSAYLFYYLNWNRKLTISLAGGPQYYQVEQTAVPKTNAWSPGGSGSIGWHTTRSNFAASYSRSVGAYGGLVGAFTSNSADAQASREIAANWTVGMRGDYAITKNASQQPVVVFPGGHSITGTGYLQHKFGESLSAEAGYSRLHQSYSGVSLVSTAPDSNRGYVTIIYQFTRPLGR